MALYSHIEWTEATWNPVTGCTKMSLGCKHCYAERFAKRLKAQGHPLYKNGFKPTVHPEVLDVPLRWKSPRLVFVCSMGDLFHEKVPDSFVKEVFSVMNRADRHIFQVLTKRSERMLALADSLVWTDNIWAGVTVEAAAYLKRVEHLRQVPARVRFVSFEPLLGPIHELDLHGVDWVIVGGESGPGARPMKPDWARRIRDACVSQGVAFFFKQWGGVRRKERGRLLDGKLWDQMPALLNSPAIPTG